MTDKRVQIVAWIVLLVLVLLALFVPLPRADAGGATIDVNGQAVDIGAASTFTIQSDRSVTVYEGVTVTTSIVTVTVWMKP